jgi:glutamate carboxypeptidase
MKQGIIAFSIICIALTASAQLSKIEKKISAQVDVHHAEALKLLEEAVNINSGTMNFEGVQKVGQLFKGKFDALGFETRWADGKPFGRAGHLVATLKGNPKNKTILMIGHLDSVFELSSPLQQYKVINDSTVSGPGVGDMKGGNVVIIQAMQALKDVGLLKEMNIIVVMTGDEEHSGKPLSLSKQELIEGARIADIALGFEDADGKSNTIVVSRRSASGWTLNVKGEPSHSSQIFTEKIGAGAIYEAARIINSFYEELKDEKNLTFNPGVILGGTSGEHKSDLNGGNAYGKSNIVAKDVVVTGDIRAISPEQLQKAQQTMKAIVERHLPQTQAEIKFDEGYPPLAPTDGNYQLMQTFDQVSKDLGFGGVRAVNPRDAGAADISFTAGYVDMAIDGLGLVSSGGHTVNETADPRSVKVEAKRTAVLLYRLTQNKLSVNKPR